MLSQDHLDLFAARLAIAVYDINADLMSINDFRLALSHLPGGGNLTMRYGAGGRSEIFKIGDREIEVGPNATPADVEAAFNLKKKLKLS